MPSFEVLLPVGAIALYLYDSAQGLYGDEFVIERRRNAWRVSAGAGLLMAGRRPHLPNPFTPDALMFRVRWDRANDDGTLGADDVDTMSGLLRLPRLVVIAQLLLLAAALPVVSILLGAGATLLGLFALYYLLTFVALVALFRARAGLRLSGRQFAVLAFESVACAPFAPNLVRKVALLQSGRLRWVEVAAAFDEPERRKLGALLGASIASALVIEGTGTARAEHLDALRVTLGDRLGVAVSR